VRVTVPRLILLPLVVVAAVVTAPSIVGDHPVTWDRVQRLALTQVSRLPGHPFADRLDDPGATPDVGPWAAPRPLPAPTPSAPRERYPVHQVSRPWTTGTPQLGVHVYWESNNADPEAVVWRKAQRIVNYVTGLNANALTVSFPFFTPDIRASSVGPKAHTPSPHRVEILLHEATLAGLRITVRPILDEKSLHPPDGWRGSIRPDSPQAWFNGYRDFLRPYLTVAERQRAATFVVGTELNSLEPRPEWKALITSFRQVFTGEIGYDLNYDNYGRGLFPAGMDRYGVDAYIKVKAPASAPPSAVTAGWNAFLATVSPAAPHDVLLSEVGIGAREGAFASPGDFTSSGRYDPRTQPTWYRGVCEVAREHRLAGIYFWKVNFDADPAHPTTAGQPNLDFIGHPASEQAIRDCLGSPWSLPQGTALPQGTVLPSSARSGDHR
jgi:hypothetical protein